MLVFYRFHDKHISEYSLAPPRATAEQNHCVHCNMDDQIMLSSLIFEVADLPCLGWQETMLTLCRPSRDPARIRWRMFAVWMSVWHLLSAGQYVGRSFELKPGPLTLT